MFIDFARERAKGKREKEREREREREREKEREKGSRESNEEGQMVSVCICARKQTLCILSVDNITVFEFEAITILVFSM